ncbi:hypothetical protein [Pectobacterium polaris]|uniref:hypothetical protein n=1 Tax=Pectobacterium polaris TaxID=2042057 RepID=UPI0021C81583|nr:hypothetical protein [Pectobacterium polaris]MCU1792484.1 hypothetical protein [Pectobacterium polaris]
MDYFINHEDFSYTRILLFSWDCYLQPVILSETNGHFFAEKIKENFKSGNKKIVINCNNVLDVEDHFSDEFLKIIKNNKECSIVFYSNDRVNKLIEYIKKHINKSDFHHTFMHEEGEVSSYIISGNNVCSSTISSMISEANRIEKKKVIEVVKNSYVETGAETLSSTPLSAKGQFDATKLISKPSVFRWIVLLLVESIFNYCISNNVKGYGLVAGSLRGAAIAGSVWELLQQFDDEITIKIVDHVGPCHDVVGKRYESLGVINKEFIYIGDFLIAGTEIKLTSAYCNFIGTTLTNAFVIGKYTTKNLIDNKIKLHSLVDLNECNLNLEYKLV